MAAKIKSALDVDAELVRASGGKFEITAAGQLIYSKLATGEFPSEDQLVAQLRDIEA